MVVANFIKEDVYKGELISESANMATYVLVNRKIKKYSYSQVTGVFIIGILVIVALSFVIRALSKVKF